jgi:PAS domain S-box-containing protein
MSAGEPGPLDGAGARPLESDALELYEQAPCALLSTRPDGTIVRANATFFDWLGAAPEDVTGKVRFQMLLTVGSRIFYETHYAPLLRMQGKVNELALDIRRADGAVRPVVASAREVIDRDGVVILHRVALFDSTDRRRYEHELLEARRRAEAGSRELEQVDAQKNEFIAMLAHELRNPLAPIINALELLRRSGEPAPSEQAVGVMRRQVGQMKRLVEDLVDISRVGQDKLSLRREVIDMASVIHHASEASAPLMDAAGLRYDTVLPAEAIYVEGDAARLAQVIGNILNNAAKFTPRGGSVRLSLERDGAEARVRIRDTGMGIEPDTLARIFEMFMQAEAPSESRTGLGIGLTLARTLAERHGGRVTAHSDGVGLGSEFVLSLPALSHRPDTVVHASVVPAATERRRRRVLVVDDNRDSAEMMAALLELGGHEVRLAHDGLEAVEAAAAYAPDVVFLDIGLPGISGYEAAMRIRRLPGVQPVMAALTGWGQDEDRRKAAEAGFDHHLLKPVEHDALLALVGAAPLVRGE